MSRRARLALAWAAAALAWPARAGACAFCSAGDGRDAFALFLSTVVLSLLPLGMIAGLLFWLWRSGRASLAGEFEEHDEPPRAS